MIDSEDLKQKSSPSLDALINGLPKEMTKKHVEDITLNAAKEKVTIDRDRIDQVYEELISAADTNLKNKLFERGFDEVEAESFIENLYGNIFPVFDEEDIPDEYDPINKAAVESVKNDFGVFLPDLRDEVRAIFNIEKSLAEKYRTLNQKELGIEAYKVQQEAPKKKREYRYYQQGGAPNNLQQILGYKDNSPFRNLSSQDFYTDTLTMGGVSKPLLAIANNGEVKVMPPNSGLHRFKGATKITEVPFMQDGGNPRQMIFNLFKQRPMGRYENGGATVSPSIQYNLPVGNTKGKIDGFIDLAALVPIQTEKGELIILPTKDVTKVNAKKRHHQMDDDQVTDVVPENSYILSQFGQVDIYKSEADQAIVEVQNRPYNIYGVNPEPKTKSLGDHMTKGRMKPADLGRTLLSKYKQINNPGDPFTDQTNASNKYTLSKYLDALVYLSEMDKARKGIDNSVETQLSEQNPELMAENGGLYMNGIDQASLGGFFKKVGKGIGNVVKGVGNVAHDWGVGIADGFGNSTGLYDINNNKYKTEFGRGAAGFANSMSATTGKIGKAIGAAAVPGLSGVFNAVPNLNDSRAAVQMQSQYQNQYNMNQRKPSQWEQLQFLLPYVTQMAGIPNPIGYRNGGRVLRAGYNVPKAVDPGAIISGIAALGSLGLDTFKHFDQKKKIKENERYSLYELDKLENKNTGLENTALFANLAGFAGQNPEIKPVLENTNFLDATQRFIPQQQTDYLMGRALANRPDTSGMDPRLANGITGKYYAQALDSQSNFALQAAQARLGFLNNYLMQKQAAENRNAASRTNAYNATTANMNNLFAGAAGAVSGSMSNRQNLNTNLAQSRLAVKGTTLQNLMANNTLGQSLANTSALLAQNYNTYNNTTNRNKTTDPNAGYGSGVGPNYGGTTPTTPYFHCENGMQYSVGVTGQLIPTGRPC